jgi:hypothetical protein
MPGMSNYSQEKRAFGARYGGTKGNILITNEFLKSIKKTRFFYLSLRRELTCFNPCRFSNFVSLYSFYRNLISKPDIISTQ